MAYDENSIKTLDWREHIRMRPGMYIGKLGDGASPDDGIYVLLKEVIDNSIDEFVMGFGKKITIDVTPDGLCEVRDFGRGIPLGKLLDCAAKINTGAKYDSDAFKKSVGLNGVGIKAGNALSDFFEIQAYRDGETRSYQFCRGKEIPKGRKDGATEDPNGPGYLSSGHAIPAGVYRKNVQILLLPQQRAGLAFQRPPLHLQKRVAGPACGSDERRTPVPHHPPGRA